MRRSQFGVVRYTHSKRGEYAKECEVSNKKIRKLGEDDERMEASITGIDKSLDPNKFVTKYAEKQYHLGKEDGKRKNGKEK